LERLNLAITKLFVKSVSTGVYGRVLLHLERGQAKKTKSDEVGENQRIKTFSPGDIVGLFQSDRSAKGGEQEKVDGIVYKITNDEIVVAFNEMHEFEQFK
jgi:ATP-dependent RNA/DNA helicase IGHMBP2